MKPFHIVGRAVVVIGVACVVVAITVSSVTAQTLAQRVAKVRDGTVRMSFASRPEVCGNGRGNISTGRNHNRGSNRHEWEDDCEHGPVRVAIDVATGQVIAVRTYVGGRWTASESTTDLGLVGTREATDFLLGTVAHGSGKGAEQAIFPTTIADSVVVWPRLLEIAKDDSHEKAVRKQAVFWVSQAAGEKATAGLVEIVGDKVADSDVRLQAVFALSQRPKDEAVPALLNVAQTSRDPKIRKQAIFWLGQSNDARAIAYFEKILAACRRSCNPAFFSPNWARRLPRLP